VPVSVATPIAHGLEIAAVAASRAASAVRALYMLTSTAVPFAPFLTRAEVFKAGWRRLTPGRPVLTALRTTA